MPNKVDFFTTRCADGSLSDDVTNAAEFGLCDDPHVAGTLKSRAYLDTSNPNKWIATVDNAPRYEVTFKGIDDCITIYKPVPLTDGSLEEASRCDGMLLYEDSIIFVELKEKRRSWLESSIGQLEATIKVFADSYDLTIYKRRMAYSVNKAHPRFNESRIQSANSFFKEAGIVLRTQAMIKLEPLV
ncbi:hypothetical protein [Hymenobacter sp. BT730]|uniref:hypothetical protein n=1 Tax=Hymenobacter sp. BT730 TaxID=3063332 RepID=UPI0026DF7EC5|nr:hypothetical protein [Hymenobacter sp. BT730]